MHFAIEYQDLNVAWNDPRFYPFEARFAWVAVGVGGIFPGWGTLLGAERPLLEPLGLPFVASRPGPVRVTLTTITRGSEIRYTLNGTEPTSSSSLYNGPLELDATATVKAKTFNPGIPTSDTTTMTYVIE